MKRVDNNEKAARVDTGTAFWAVFYEKGTRSQPARPFFEPSFKRAESAVIKKLAERLRAGIDREVMKLR